MGDEGLDVFNWKIYFGIWDFGLDLRSCLLLWVFKEIIALFLRIICGIWLRLYTEKTNGLNYYKYAWLSKILL